METYKKEFQHWQYEFDPDDVLMLKLDRQNSAVNSLDQQILAELDQLLTALIALELSQQTHLPRALIIYSGKKNGFIAGADITQFIHIKTHADAFALMLQAQQVLAKLASLPLPTVAMIHGYCLGGGLELALACQYRFAEDAENTTLGLPEVHLGLHPGWGGTVRLPQLIGVHPAMKMMLTGIPVSAQAALDLGLVDQVIPASEFLTIGKQRTLALLSIRQATESSSAHNKQNPVAESEDNQIADALVTNPISVIEQLGLIVKNTQKNLNQLLTACGEIWQRKILKRKFWSAGCRPWVSAYYYHWLNRRINKFHYPAATVVVDNWRKAGACGNEAYLNEAHSIARLMVTETGQQLIRLFLTKAKMKAAGKQAMLSLQHIHIIGCGHLGRALALRGLQQGFKVSFYDIDVDQVNRLQTDLQQYVNQKHRNHHSVNASHDNIIADQTGEQVKLADVVIEAVPEDFKIKQSVLNKASQHLAPQALLLTTTACLNINNLTSELSNPDRLVGFHWLSPDYSSEVIEVVTLTQTSPQWIAEVAALVIRLGWLPVVVPAASGYLLLQVLLPYLMEAMYLVDEKIPIDEIDQAARAFGMNIGPLALADAIGLNVCAELMTELSTDHQPLPLILQHKIAAGHYGCRSGQGFYHYSSPADSNFLNRLGDSAAARWQKDTSTLLTAHLIERLIPVFVKAAQRVASLKWVADEAIFDAAFVYGAGFAAYRGGPLNYSFTLSTIFFNNQSSDRKQLVNSYPQ